MGKIRHQLTLDDEATNILKEVDNKSGYAQEAIKFYTKKEMYEKQEVPKLRNVRVSA